MPNRDLSLGDDFAGLLSERDPDRRWSVLTRGLARMGLDQVNYAFLDMATYDRMEARGDPAMSTMRSDWIEYYTERMYDMHDPLVGHVRAARYDPVIFETTTHYGPSQILNEADEAGLAGGILIPLPGAPGTLGPGAGIVMGSGMDPAECRRLLEEHGPRLVSLAHLFHAGAVGEMMRRRYGAAKLTARERDCLQAVARGQRVSGIAHHLALAEVTVSLHLKNARYKLGARSLPEAVARALLFQQIEVA
ncbi:MAG: LuxR family transcriptional regulator [Caulobacteraceae bacterium]|nr:LuxR family transcriptional regulator [Caulobacteraceae bacterium]